MLAGGLHVGIGFMALTICGLLGMGLQAARRAHMSMTLNIVEHELEGFGAVTRTDEGNPVFDKMRMFLGLMPASVEGTLFLSSDADHCSQIRSAGGCCVFVCKPGSGASAQADLTLETERDLLEVFDGLLEAHDRYCAWESEMDLCASREDGLQELVDASAPFLRNHTVIVDPALKLLAYTGSIPCDDPVTVELIEHGYHTNENIRKFKLHKRFGPWAEDSGFIVNESHEICKYTTVVRSFKTQHSFSLIIVMMCNVCEPSDYLLDAYLMFAERVERFALRDYPDDKPSGNATDTFMRDLMRGELTDTEVLAERCKHVGIPYYARFCLFYIATPTETVPMQRLIADLATTVAPAKTVAMAGGIAILCFNCLNDKCSLRCESGACPSAKAHRSISARIEATMERVDLLCGRSSKFKYLHEAPIAFEQARAACRIAARKSRCASGIKDFVNWKRIFSFERCFCEYMVEQMDAGAELALCTYGGRVIDDMAKRDAQTGNDDYEFLFEYLVNERKPSIVAEKLHMHRNNVKYRIDKIEERFGIDTDDPALRLMVLFAYKLREAGIAQNTQLPME